MLLLTVKKYSAYLNKNDTIKSLGDANILRSMLSGIKTFKLEENNGCLLIRHWSGKVFYWQDLEALFYNHRTKVIEGGKR